MHCNCELDAPANNPDWMRDLPDLVKLTKLSIPGTHESMSFHGCNTHFCHYQSITLMGQLLSGIRVLDIHCRHINNGCAIHHGLKYLDANLDDVLTTVNIFLAAHPHEMIFMRMKGDDYNSEGNTCSWPGSLNSYKGKYSGIIWEGDIKTSLARVPTLGNTRGKIVINDTTRGGWGSQFDVQNKYNLSSNWDLYEKWVSVKSQITNSNNTVVAPWFVASGHAFPSTSSNWLSTRLVDGITAYSDTFPDFPWTGCFLGGLYNFI